MSKLVHFINRLPWLAVVITITLGLANERWYAEEQSGIAKVHEQYLNSGMFAFEKQHYLDYHVRSVPVDFSHQNTDYSDLVETLGDHELDPTLEQVLYDYRFVAYMKEKGLQFLYDSEHANWIQQRQKFMAFMHDQLPSVRLGITPLGPDLALDERAFAFYKTITSSWFDRSPYLILFGLILLAVSIGILELIVGRAASLALVLSSSIMVSEVNLLFSDRSQVVLPGLSSLAITVFALSLILFYRSYLKENSSQQWSEFAYPATCFLTWAAAFSTLLNISPKTISISGLIDGNSDYEILTVLVSTLIAASAATFLVYLFGTGMANKRQKIDSESPDDTEYRQELANAFEALESFDFVQARSRFSKLAERFPNDRTSAQQNYYLAAAQQDKQLSDYVELYADTLILQKDYSRAMSLLRQLQQITLSEGADRNLAANYETSYAKLLNLFLNSGQLKAAEQCFSLLYQTSPNHNLVNEAGYLLHSAFEKQGLREKAQQFARYSAESTAARFL